MNGPFFAVIAALLFGLNAPIAKSLIGNIEPWLLAGLLYLGSGVGMTVVFAARELVRKGPAVRINAKDLPCLLGVTLFGGVIGPVLLMYGLSYTPTFTDSSERSS